MNDRYQVVFDGELRTESPFATTPVTTRTGRSAEEPLPLPLMSVFFEQGYVETVYIPASGIRGALRRCALRIVREALMASSGEATPLDLETHYFLAVGGIKGRDKENRLNLTRQMLQRRRNPLISLFGAGDPWIQGRLCVQHAIPKHPLSLASTPVISGVRSDDFIRSPEQLEFLDPDQIAQWLAQREQTSETSQLKAKVRELKRELVIARRDGDDENIQQLKRQLEDAQAVVHASKAPVNMPLAGYHVIPQGTLLTHRFLLLNVTAEEWGLFLAILRCYAEMPLLGGHHNHGCGLITGDWTISIRADGQIIPQGQLQITPFAGSVLSNPGDQLLAAQQVWSQRAAKLSREDVLKVI